MAKFYSIYPSAVMLGTAILPVVLTNLTLIPYTHMWWFLFVPENFVLLLHLSEGPKSLYYQIYIHAGLTHKRGSILTPLKRDFLSTLDFTGILYYSCYVRLF
jgi:hypothetical protein